MSKAPAADLLKVRPSVKGALSWAEDKTLVFTPNDNFESDTRYAFEIDLKKLYGDIASDKRYFSFDIKTLLKNGVKRMIQGQLIN